MNAPHLSIDERRAVCMERGSVRTVAVNCVVCGKGVTKPYRHDASDLEIANRCFPRWRIKGVRGALKTVCPTCQ